MGQWIPGDTSVNMAVHATHQDSSIFPDPESFKPERWLDEEERKRMEPYFIPFSAGTRGSIGRNISYLEQVVVLAGIVQRYHFALPYPGWELERYEAFNLLVGEMPLKISRRGKEVGELVPDA
ncbi:cytochrome P450 [Aspergillus oleicola]